MSRCFDIHLWISFTPNAAVLFVDVAIQPEVRFIAKQNLLMKIGNNGNLVLGPFDESTPCLMIVLMNCQTKLRINHLAAVKSVAILEKTIEEILVLNGDLIPDHLRRLALEITDGIPSDTIKIYTDCSRLSDQAGSGIYIEKRGERSFFHHNPDFSIVFKSELIAIEHGLEAVLNEKDFEETSGFFLIVAVLSNILITGSQSETKLASPYF
ncbi:adhesion G protein-coupled receptor B2 [Trichonephila clavipes]|uniref:Adhesion G protein-coupled receptor B2 n=1 Tax=Trichonephila clavipes TaxID=2585209 RepID=A0A8X6RIX4_TRICX|nr:adhesion G protein-coupled receptor B2 [Trichonephila clavipes]